MTAPFYGASSFLAVEFFTRYASGYFFITPTFPYSATNAGEASTCPIENARKLSNLNPNLGFRKR